MFKDEYWQYAAAFSCVLFVQACGGGGGGDDGNSQTPSPRFESVTTLSQESSISLDEDTSLSSQLVTNQSPRISYSITSAPSNGEVAIENGNFTYTPNIDFNGEDAFSYSVTDDGETIEHRVSIIITPVNDIPVLMNESYSYTIAKNETYSFAIEVHDVDGDSLAFEILDSPQNSAVSVDENGVLSVVPNNDFLGDESFLFRVDDNAGGQVEQLVDFSVVNPLQIAHQPLDFVVETNQATQSPITLYNHSQQPLTFQLSLDYAPSSETLAQKFKPAANQYLEVKKGETDPRTALFRSNEPAEPDAFSYEWTDSNSEHGPTFVWTDISETGTLVDGLSDDSVTFIPLTDFSFPFYEENYSFIYLSSNGFISFDHGAMSGCCSGQPLPSDDRINNIIAWMWADLHPQSGQVYTLLEEDQFTIQFSNYGEYNGSGTVDAQVVLHTDGTITFYYHSFTGGMEDKLTSIGIENADATSGLQVAFNETYLEPQLAVQFSPPTPDWASIPIQEGILEPRSQIDIPLTISGSDTIGDHSATLNVDNLTASTHYPLDISVEITPDITPPNSITDLTTDALSFDHTNIAWTTVTDSGVTTPPAASYEIRMHDEPITQDNWSQATLIDYPITSSEDGLRQTVYIPNLVPQTSYSFAVTASDQYGNTSALSNNLGITTLAPPEAEIDTASFETTLSQGQASTQSLVLQNNGEATLEYQIRIEQLLDPMVNAPATANRTINRETKARTLSQLPEAGTFSEDRIIVRYKGITQRQHLNELAVSANAHRTKTIPRLNMEVWTLDQPSAMLDTIQRLMRDPDILSVEPDRKLYAYDIPNDPDFPLLWGLHNVGQNGGVEDADIDAPEAWDLLTGASNVVIAVIDSGIDHTHPDLIDNMWINPNEIPGNNIDDDGNGFIDDIYGFDFVNNDGNPMDDDNHGTHVAGTIGAVGDNTIGITGVMQNVQLMGVKFLDANGSGFTSNAIESIIYAVDNGATILNNSWGGGGFDTNLLAAIEYANENGVLFVAAAGNSGRDNDAVPNYPSNYDVDNVIAVAALDRTNQLASFSQYGATTVDLGAPGVAIYSSIPGGYDSFNGTSMATPHVAGVAGLVQAYSTDISLPVLRQVLLDSTVAVSALDGVTVTGGAVNAFNALMLAPPPWLVIDPEQLAGQIEAGESVEITLYFNAENLNEGVTYQRVIIIETNDPNNPTIEVPVTIIINPDITPPAAVTDLSIVTHTDTSIQVTFTATGDDENTGIAESYDIRYSDEEINDDNWVDATPFTNVNSPNEAGTTEQFELSGLVPNTHYHVAMRVIDNFDLSSTISNSVEFTTFSSQLSFTPNSFPNLFMGTNESRTLLVDVENTGTANLVLNINTQSDIGGTSTAKVRGHISTPELEKGQTLPEKRGRIQSLGSGGPDNFGYRWIDSNEPNGPQYVWNDISAVGTPISGLFDDVFLGPFPIGFEFPFYGNLYTEFYISSNGYISFSASSNSGCCAGRPLPADDGINHLIAWLWYDLYPGDIYYQVSDNGDLVIQFHNYGEFGGSGQIDAQVQLSPNGNIQLLYNDIRNGMRTDRASIGIENSDGTDGLQVSYVNDYVTNELAILLSAGWLKTNVNTLSIAPGETAQIEVDVSTTSLSPGNYRGILQLNSNDPEQSNVELEVNLTVVNE